MKLPELKPCPFCGSEAMFVTDLSNTAIDLQIECTADKDVCGATLGLPVIVPLCPSGALNHLLDGVDKLAERWNQRIDDDRELVELLQEEANRYREGIDAARSEAAEALFKFGVAKGEVRRLKERLLELGVEDKFQCSLDL